MRKLTTIILLIAAVQTATAQRVTFYSEEFEAGVRRHIGLGEDDEVTQSQTDTITAIDLSGLGITDIRDVVYLPNVKELDLSNNGISNTFPLIVLDSLQVLNLSSNELESVNPLAFSNATAIRLNIAYNHIEDLTYFCTPVHCQFTLTGADLQSPKDAPYFDVYQLYADADNDEGLLQIFYRGFTNLQGQTLLSCGETSVEAGMNGSYGQVPLTPAELNGETVLHSNGAAVVRLSNGDFADSTYVVPVTGYEVSAGATITMNTGLPENYRVTAACSRHGTATAIGNAIEYTAPETAEPDVVSFSYYQGSTLKGFSRFYINKVQKGDVNGDGDVDIADAVCIVNHIVGKPNSIFIETAADVNNDGDIDIADAVHIVNYVVGKIQVLARRFEWNLSEPE